MDSKTNVTNALTAPSKEEICSGSVPIETAFISSTVYLIAVMVATLIGNLMVLLAVIFFRELRSITNYFICSLAVSDLLIACLSLPFRLDQNIHNANWCRSLETCKTWFIIDSMCTFASMWNLAVISIDRCMAIKCALKYPSLMTHKVGYRLISFVWIFSIFIALLMLLNWTKPGELHFSIVVECANYDRNYYTMAVSFSFFLPLLIIVVMYGMVFEVALHQTRAMATLNNRNSINFIREVKAAKTLAVVIGCFVLCWLPFNIILMILLWDNVLLLSLDKPVLVVLSSVFVSGLPIFNSAMNPIIYALLNRKFRSAFKKITKRLTGNPFCAVGYNGTMDSTTGSVSALNNHNIERPSQDSDVHFRDSERSDNQPANPTDDLLLYRNEVYTDHLGSVNNNFNVNADMHSMETTLDDAQRTSVDNSDATTPNVHVQNNKHAESDVISDDDVTGKEAGDSSNVNITANLQPLQGTASLPKENDDTPLTIFNLSTLTPIESNTPDRDREVPSSSNEAAKIVNIQPSPNLVKKNSEDENNLEKCP